MSPKVALPLISTRLVLKNNLSVLKNKLRHFRVKHILFKTDKCYNNHTLARKQIKKMIRTLILGIWNLSSNENLSFQRIPVGLLLDSCSHLTLNVKGSTKELNIKSK
jgi:hypothetical protein